MFVLTAYSIGTLNLMV